MDQQQPATPVKKPTPELVIRPVSTADESFIYNSWLESFRDAPFVRGVPNSIYYKEQHRLIEDILHRPNCRIAIACNPADQNQIYGYAVYESFGENQPMMIHWVYCKHPFRLYGIGGKLAEHMTEQLPSIICYSHTTKMTAKVVKNRPYIYNPFTIRS